MLRKLAVSSVLTAVLYATLTLPASAPAVTAAVAETDSGLSVHTAGQVASTWQSLMKPKSNPALPYISEPSVTAPYLPGTLRDDYIRDGLNALNFYRYVAGLPADVVTDDELNLRAAYGSVLLASEGNFGHTPPKPANMPDDFYKLAYASTSTANIFTSFGYNDHILVHSMQAYMADSDASNLARLGHRRWILNPPLKKAGFGLAEGNNKFSYTALQVFDKSRTAGTGYHYIAYPAKGAFPVEAFGAGTAWSVSLNPAEFAVPSEQSVKVTLTRLRDNRQWHLNSAVNTVTDTGAYFNVETSGYGAGPAVIFRPNGVQAYRPGDRYQVAIEGLAGPDGSAKRILYTVDFMSAEGSSVISFTDTSHHWAKQTIDWAAGRGIAAGYPNGMFKPDNKVSEAEFVKMFVVAAGAEVEPTSVWSDAYYEFAAAHGFSLRGLKDGNVRSQPLNRQAVAELLASAAGQLLSGNEAIQYVLDQGYAKGKTAPTVEGYRGMDTLTRAEAVQFIKNMLDAHFELPVVDVKLP